jgi:putative ABC transport system ATP-binding protein
MIVLQNVVKTYKAQAGEVRALNNISFRVETGEFVVVCGPSGSGKTTLLMSIAAMLRPTGGSVYVEQNNLYEMSMRERAKYRARTFGFVFQLFYLLPYLNVIENVALAGLAIRDRGSTAEANELLERLGLVERALHKPSELSAGEKQRVAIARALFNRPKIILADEPTGNLDPDNATLVLEHISDFHRQGGTVVVATHGQTVQQLADRVIYLQEGVSVKL